LFGQRTLSFDMVKAAQTMKFTRFVVVGMMVFGLGQTADFARTLGKFSATLENARIRPTAVFLLFFRGYRSFGRVLPPLAHSGGMARAAITMKAATMDHTTPDSAAGAAVLPKCVKQALS